MRTDIHSALDQALADARQDELAKVLSYINMMMTQDSTPFRLTMAASKALQQVYDYVLERGKTLESGETPEHDSELLSLLAEVISDEDCHYDHHGYCQAHYLHERPCPHERAKELLGTDD